MSIKTICESKIIIYLCEPNHFKADANLNYTIMQKISFLIIILVLMASCTNEPHYTITGKIEGSDTVTFLIQKREAGKLVTIDSAVSRKGSFKIKGGAIDYPQLIQFVAKGKGLRTSFYIENAEISITGRLDSLFNAKISGSKTQDEYQSFINSNKLLSERYSNAYANYQTSSQTGDKPKVAEYENEIKTIQGEMTALQKEFVRNNPGSFVAPSILNSLSYSMEAEEIESYLKPMDSIVARIPVIMSLKERVAVMKTVVVGQKAPDFTMNDVNGNPVTLSSKIGSRLLLIDFWAAWCGPCRQENPNVARVFNEYKNKGFDIIGVSLDSKKEDWIKAISDDKLTWTHVSDLLRGNNAAAKLYAINVIPSNFLLDEKGIIIARNLTGEALFNKVKEVLGGK